MEVFLFLSVRVKSSKRDCNTREVSIGRENVGLNTFLTKIFFSLVLSVANVQLDTTRIEQEQWCRHSIATS